MSGRGLRVAVIVLSALAAAEARATDVVGWLGASADRFDTWQKEQGASREQRLHLDLGAQGAGYLGGPSDLNWDGRFQYARDRQDWTGARYDQNILTFNAAASLFDVRESVLALRAGADRSQSDQAQTASGVALTGTSLSNSANLGARLGGTGNAPLLSLTGSVVDSNNTGLGRPDLHSTMRELVGTVAHGGDGYTYQLGYRGREEQGTYITPYLSQWVTLNAKTTIGATDVGITGQDFARSPRVASGTSPTYDDTAFSAYTNTRLDGFGLRTQYDFGHGLVEDAALPTTERYTHNLAVTSEHRLSNEWSLLPTVSLAYAQERSGTDEKDASGQSAGVLARWTRNLPDRTYGLEGGGTLGLLEPTTGPATRAWGTTAAARISQTSGLARYGGAYRLEYASDLAALSGWSLTQSLSGDYTRPLSAASLVANLTASAQRAHSTLFGDTANRYATAIASLQWQDKSFGTSLTLSDGVSGALGNPVHGDALFLPANFQTHSRMGSLFGSATWRGTMVTYGSVQYTQTESPDAPTQKELLWTGRITYRVGQLAMSLEDKYRLLGADTYDLRINQVMVTLVRYFRW
jgi:hypothetical protein